jgi:replication-associated recombination protein RarA
LRSEHPYQRNKMREGGGYVYPHNDPSGFVAQEYRPSPHGREAAVGERLRMLWGDAAYDGEEWWRYQKFSDPSR